MDAGEPWGAWLVLWSWVTAQMFGMAIGAFWQHRLREAIPLLMLAALFLALTLLLWGESGIEKEGTL